MKGQLANIDMFLFAFLFPGSSISGSSQGGVESALAWDGGSGAVGKHASRGIETV